MSLPLRKNVELDDCLTNVTAIRLFTVICLSIDRDVCHRLLPNICLNGGFAGLPALETSTRYRAISTNYLVVIALPIMDDTRQYKYYRTSGYGLNSLVRNADRLGYPGSIEDFNFSWIAALFQIYRFLIADYNLRRFFNLSAYCGAVTFVTFIFVAIMTVCSIAVSLARSNSNYRAGNGTVSLLWCT